MNEGLTGVIYVFGSNKAGKHGAGNALFAKLYKGAIYGRGVGRQGNSYAIPTRDYDIYTTLPLAEIKGFIDDFIVYANAHPELTFKVPAIGTGNAGYKHQQMAPLFAGVPKNCTLSGVWNRINKELRLSSAGQDLDSSTSVKQA